MLAFLFRILSHVERRGRRPPLRLWQGFGLAHRRRSNRRLGHGHRFQVNLAADGPPPTRLLLSRTFGYAAAVAGILYFLYEYLISRCCLNKATREKAVTKENDHDLDGEAKEEKESLQTPPAIKVEDDGDDGVAPLPDADAVSAYQRARRYSRDARYSLEATGGFLPHMQPALAAEVAASDMADRLQEGAGGSGRRPSLMAIQPPSLAELKNMAE